MIVNCFLGLKVKSGNKRLKFSFLGLMVILFMSPDVTEAQIKVKEGSQRIYKFNHAQGFYQNTVKSIAEDKNGYLWFSTANGLIRYDGYDFENFYHDFEDKYSIPHNVINKIFEGSDGKLWIGTKGGTCLYFPDEERFLSLENNIVGDAFIKEDSKKNIWIGNNSELYIYKPTFNSRVGIEKLQIINLKQVLLGERIIDILFFYDEFQK